MKKTLVVFLLLVSCLTQARAVSRADINWQKQLEVMALLEFEKRFMSL